MKCKIIKPLLGLKCNIYDSVFKENLKYSCSCLYKLSLESKFKKNKIKKLQHNSWNISYISKYLSSFYAYSTMQLLTMTSYQTSWIVGNMDYSVIACWTEFNYSEFAQNLDFSGFLTCFLPPVFTALLQNTLKVGEKITHCQSTLSRFIQLRVRVN